MWATDPIRVRVLEGTKAVFLYFSPFYVLILVIAALDVFGVGDPDINSLLLVLTYPAGAAAMGALAGALVPLMRRLPGAILAGVIAVIPFVGGIVVAIESGFRDLSDTHAVVSALMILIFGPVVGLSVREAFYDNPPLAGVIPRKAKTRASRKPYRIIPPLLVGGLTLGVALGFWVYGLHWSVSLLATYVALRLIIWAWPRTESEWNALVRPGPDLISMDEEDAVQQDRESLKS